MNFSQDLGYVLAVFVGITLGMIGSGGSILSVPVLVYVMQVNPVLATAYSLFIVGSSALIGGIQKARQKLVDFKKAAIFGIPTLISVFLTRKFLMPMLPDSIPLGDDFHLQKSVLIMLIFALVMIFAAVQMIRPRKIIQIQNGEPPNYFYIVLEGIFIGLIAGFVGAGGGFLIIPALIFLAKTPMKMAVGTSLFIIAAQSLVGFIGDIQSGEIMDWTLLFIFTTGSVIGVFIGNSFGKKIAGEKLKRAFGWFVLAMGVYIIVKELSGS